MFSSVEVIRDPEKSCFSEVPERKGWLEWVQEQMRGKDWETTSINNLSRSFAINREQRNLAKRKSGVKR